MARLTASRSRGQHGGQLEILHQAAGFPPQDNGVQGAFDPEMIRMGALGVGRLFLSEHLLPAADIGVGRPVQGIMAEKALHIALHQRALRFLRPVEDGTETFENAGGAQLMHPHALAHVALPRLPRQDAVEEKQIGALGADEARVPVGNRGPCLAQAGKDPLRELIMGNQSRHDQPSFVVTKYGRKP